MNQNVEGVLAYALIALFLWWIARPKTWGSGGGTGYKSAAYKREFSRQRRRVLARDGYRCRVCGSTRDLHVHHRQPRARGGTNAESNLVTLCHYHHCQAHGRRF